MTAHAFGSGAGARGLANYLLFGKRPAGSLPEWYGDDQGDPDRVAWIATENIVGADDINDALRNMHRTRELASVLKAAAGVSARGRPVKTSYEHGCLSWQNPHVPSKADCMEAVRGYLEHRKMAGHQVLVIAHKDTDHFHVHLIVLKVHPERGTTARPDHSRKLNAWSEQWCNQQAWPVPEYHPRIRAERQAAIARGEKPRVVRRRKEPKAPTYTADEKETWRERYETNKQLTAGEARKANARTRRAIFRARQLREAAAQVRAAGGKALELFTRVAQTLAAGQGGSRRRPWRDRGLPPGEDTGSAAPRPSPSTNTSASRARRVSRSRRKGHRRPAPCSSR